MSDGYHAALQALYALAPSGMVLGLDPVRAALAHFHHPQRGPRIIHIAGTNGKGSTSAFVARALRAHGRRVGWYTSPHLHRFAERIRVDDHPISEDVLARHLHAVLRAREVGEIPPLTLFEAATIAAWTVFREQSVDDVVLEVGLGGRLDATNVCDPAACAIVSIGLDHTALLGDTHAKIAAEKAGILKHGVPFVLGPSLGPEASGEDRFARESILAVARLAGAHPLEAPACERVAIDARGRSTLRFSGPEVFSATLALAGEHQADNARVAVGLLRALDVSSSAIAEGLATARWPARCERVENTLLDAAHNPPGILALRAVLSHDPAPPDRRALVFGASSDKDWRSALDALAPWCPPSAWFLCAANLPRALSPEVLATHQGGTPCPSVADALARARARVGPDGTALVCGSIFVAAAARALLLGEREDPPLGL
jgi:dihydrofolate synthase/folylpolyglutamate synthase